MRRYDDTVDVRTGNGYESSATGGLRGAPAGSPAQFLWRGHLWQVRHVLAHWVETGEWWRSSRARAVVGTDRVVGPRTTSLTPSGDPLAELLEEREVWRVEARRPLIPGASGPGAGVFELARDAAADRWQLVGCSD